jgi:hypothetical protein
MLLLLLLLSLTCTVPPYWPVLALESAELSEDADDAEVVVSWASAEEMSSELAFWSSLNEVMTRTSSVVEVEASGWTSMS